MNQIFLRLQMMIAKGVVSLVSKDKIQVQVLDEETLTNIERVEAYGHSSRPKKGSQAYLMFPSGDRSYGIAIIIGDKRYQLDLEEGESALHDDEGNYVKIKRGGVVETKASTKVIADTPLFETTQNAKIGGNLVVLGQTSSAGGFFGSDGGAAKMAAGLDVLAKFTVNGKDIDESHTHEINGQHTNGVD